MADEGFHEIHLSGKQLVFLFMATTIVSVVIFLCGVLVGRGVSAERAAELAMLAENGNDTAVAPPLAREETRLPAGDEGLSDGAATADELSYHRRLDTDSVGPETLPPAEPPPVTIVEEDDPEPPPAAARPAPLPPPVPAAPAPKPVEIPAASAAGDDGFVVQVAALRQRVDAENIAQRLLQRGYPAFVMDPGPGGPAGMYRVRVGRYRDRSEAEQVMRRLEREEQFKPWITR